MPSEVCLLIGSSTNLLVAETAAVSAALDIGFFDLTIPGLFLASIGLYGVTSYSVSRRTSEIGVRVAVGARSPQILWLVLRQVAALAGLGLLVGVPLSLALGPLMGSLLFGVAPSDPLTVALAGLTMVGVALAAGFFPALRASRLDAILALRME